MLITGNIQVSKTHLTMGCDMVFPTSVTPETVAPFRRLASAMHGASGNNGSLAIAQISHTGRQAANFMGGRFPFLPPLAPSATRVGSGAKDGIISRIAYSILFQTARAMSPPEIEEVIAGFVRGAVVAMEAGFDGIQLHASHGCMLSQKLCCSF
jgi:2,4-dienoyl-CoA reductase-like NADH-dependent reductase (Old Yellow Enzyme family)